MTQVICDTWQRTPTRVAASIVTFNPEAEKLEDLLNRLKYQVDEIILVDNASAVNGSCSSRVKDGPCPVTYLQLPENMGVGAAHNAAIRYAMAAKFTHVALFDQDSQPEDGMVAALLNAETDLSSHHKHLAALGPQYFDPRHKAPAPFIRLENGWVKKIQAQPDDQYIPVDYLITSGSLINLEVIQEIGLMDESLFIDYVDIEWCLRAKSMGYQSFGVCAAKMQHHLGDEVVAWRGGRRMISVRSPLRNYYLFRNAALLYQRNYISAAWVANDALRLILKLGFFSLMTPPRLTNLKMMVMGFWHGLLGRSGRYPG